MLPPNGALGVTALHWILSTSLGANPLWTVGPGNGGTPFLQPTQEPLPKLPSIPSNVSRSPSATGECAGKIQESTSRTCLRPLLPRNSRACEFKPFAFLVAPSHVSGEAAKALLLEGDSRSCPFAAKVFLLRHTPADHGGIPNGRFSAGSLLALTRLGEPRSGVLWGSVDAFSSPCFRRPQGIRGVQDTEVPETVILA